MCDYCGCVEAWENREAERSRKNEQWFWMMDYCKRKGFPPAQEWSWDKARAAYDKFTQRDQ